MKRLQSTVAALSIAVLVFAMLALPAAAQEKVKITWWFGGNDFIQNELIPAFEKEHPNIDIDFVPIDGGKQDKILAAFLGGTAPDILWGWPEERVMLPEAGMIIPLDRYLNEWDGYDDFFKGAWLSSSHKGKIYGIPYYLDLRALLYRKDIFNEVGVDSSQPPQNWDDLLDAAKKIVRYDSDGKIVRAGFHVNDFANDFSPFLWQAGGDYLNSDYTKANMMDKDSLRALEFYADMVLEHNLSPPTGVDNAWGEAFYSGSLGMLYANSAVPFRVKQNSPEYYDDIGSGIPPADKQRKIFLHADYLAISSTSKHPDEAFEVLKYFYRPDNLEKFSAVQGLTPPRKSLMTSDYAEDNPVMLEILQAAPYGRPQPPMKQSPEFFKATTEMLQDVLQGKVAPRAAAERFDKYINAVLAQDSK